MAAQKKAGSAKDAGMEHTGDFAQTERLSEKKRRELWLYLAASIVAVELLLIVGAVFYAFLSAARSNGGAVHSFPWLSWGGLAVLIPTAILLAVHQADVGLFRPSQSGDGDAEWQKHLPDRMRKIYRIIKGAPAVVVLLGVVVLGGALLSIEGALGALGAFAAALEPHLPLILGGLVIIVLAGIAAAVWLNYRTRRLYAEYEFRREIFEKTGVIIVDKGSMPLPPGGTGAIPYAVLSSNELESPKALPEATRAAVAAEVGRTKTPEAEPPLQTAEAVPGDETASNTNEGEGSALESRALSIDAETAPEATAPAEPGKTAPANASTAPLSAEKKKNAAKAAETKPGATPVTGKAGKKAAAPAGPAERKKSVIRAPE